MAATSSFQATLHSLSDSLSSAVSSLPAHDPSATSEVSILAPADGISLLDTKNEILLSYLQNLVFLVLLQVRELSATKQRDDDAVSQSNVVKKLTELRVYLERGVRPLEGKLKYQIDKILKAAEDMERSQGADKKKQTTQTTQSGNGSSGSGSEDGSDDEEEDEDVDELAYRPNLAGFSKAAEAETKEKLMAKPTDGIYRPPKIKPTALPPDLPDRRAGREAHKGRARIIDEFVNAEMSSAPMAEPSIGSTIRRGGRETQTQRDREIAAERRAYEETNFVRLPKETKKERAKRPKRQGGYGGEDWRGLAEGADRIERLTRRSRASGGAGALERSRKRPAEDGPRGGNIGDSFEKRRKKVAGWKR